MRTNLDYMSTVLFAGHRRAQKASDRRAKEKTEPVPTLDWMVKQATGSDAIGAAQLLPFARTQSDPYGYLKGRAEDAQFGGGRDVGIVEEVTILRDFFGLSEAVWDEFTESVDEFLSELDLGIGERADNRWAELEPESNDWSAAETDTAYMDSQYTRDVEDMDDAWAVPYTPAASKEWGFYNEEVTDSDAKSMMRMRYRDNDLFVGAVKVPGRRAVGLAADVPPSIGVFGLDWIFDQRRAECHVNGCDWKMPLFLNVLRGENFVRQFAEYETIAILAHLGEHTRSNPRNYWTPINEVKPYRDTLNDKAWSGLQVAQLQSGLISEAYFHQVMGV